MTIQENIKKLNEAKLNLQDHPMAFDVYEELGRLIVILPQKIAGINGFRIALTENTSKAYEQALAKAEELWKYDNPFYI